jgi:asparagine synthase (glutamine-hydrolysing)
MKFHVVFNGDRGGVDLDRLAVRDSAASAQRRKLVGKDRRVGFFWSDPHPTVQPGHRTAIAKIDQSYWLIGRVRLDRRQELSVALSLDIRTAEIPDALLCLRAYERWGDHFLDHLRGDFCFVIWDEHRCKLSCARDQLGVRPLFYARVGCNWHISDSLENIASLNDVDLELDKYWIADFLGVGYCLDSNRTVYKNITRVPPAHVVSLSDNRTSVQKYWTLEVREPLFYPKSNQYIEHFQELLSIAIADRLPLNGTGISLSGGLDSSTLAALTLKVAGDPSRIVAHNRHFEILTPDEEKKYSALVADSLGIEIVHRAVDDVFYDCDWFTRDVRTPEPHLSVTNAITERLVAEEMSCYSKVWFYGEGPDNALQFEWRPYLQSLAERRDWGQLAIATVGYFRGKELREWRATVKRAFSRGVAKSNAGNEKIAWLNESFARDVNFFDRLEEDRCQSFSNHPWHPRALASFKSPIWQSFLEPFDPAMSGTPLDWRHPYLDLRVLTFLLSVPPVPWARRKRLLRDSMRGVLPDVIVNRDKTPLASDLAEILMRKHPLPKLACDSPIWSYLDVAEMRESELGNIHSGDLLRILVLDKWLTGRVLTGKYY